MRPYFVLCVHYKKSDAVFVLLRHEKGAANGPAPGGHACSVAACIHMHQLRGVSARRFLSVSDRWHFLVAACQTQGWCEIMSGFLQLSAAPSVGNPLVVLPCSQASVCPITSSFCSSLRAALISIL